MDEEQKSFVKWAGVVTAGLLAIPFLYHSLYQIDTGNVGVEKYFGQYNSVELPPGVYFKPLASVLEVSTKDNLISHIDLKPKTSDQITIEDLDVDIYYQINPTKASDIIVKLAADVERTKEGSYVVGSNYVHRASREAVYTAMTGIKAAEAQAHRATLPADVRDLLQKELDKNLGKNYITVTNVNYRNLVVDSKLEAAMRAAVQMKYQIDAKEAEVRLASAEAERQRMIARGEADAAKIKAEGLQSAKGAEYLEWLKIRNQELAIEKWDGKLPATVAGGATPMISLNK